MKILVTNDDSINSEGLRILVEFAKQYGEVFVVAPLYEQSAKSHYINIVDGLELAKVDYGLGVDTYTFNSTPADCVRAAEYGLKNEFDIVFSGINNGYNLGEDIAYSGTVAATTEAAFMGKKAIAFSTSIGNFPTVLPNLKEAMDYIFMNKFLEIGNLYNINIPPEPQGIKLTKQGSTHFNTIFVKEQDLFYQRGNQRYHLDKDNINSDVWAIINNYISITPLNYDRTDYNILKKIINN